MAIVYRQIKGSELTWAEVDNNFTELYNKAFIAFPAVQVPSANANTLDDYEEGTWTPTLAGDTTAGTNTYSTQAGRFTKIGNMVTVSCNLVLSGNSVAMVGNGRISGLPFTHIDNNQSGSVAMALNVVLPAGTSSIGFVANGTNLDLQAYGSNTNLTQVPVANFTSLCRISFNYSYLTNT